MYLFTLFPDKLFHIIIPRQVYSIEVVGQMREQTYASAHDTPHTNTRLDQVTAATISTQHEHTIG